LHAGNRAGIGEDGGAIMTPWLILAVAGAYFGALCTIAWWTGRKADAAGYFLGNRQSRWYVVAFGLIGDSLSGVTYISVPGKVAVDHFGYFQMVLGYVLGYALIAEVLIPMYYRLNLTSIYGFLGERFGTVAQKTGSGFFLLSRMLGAAARLYLAANVFQEFVFKGLGVPFFVTVGVIILLMLAYTLKGGIRTLVWTDSFQSLFLVLGVVLSVVIIGHDLGLGAGGMITRVWESEMSGVFNWDWRSPGYFWKQFLSGAAITLVMTGLDQNNMQKSLSCPTPGTAKKNLYSFALVQVPVNLFFLSLGVLLFAYAKERGVAIPTATDQLFPTLALQHLGTAAAVVFVLGLTAATFNSADSVLTTLTTSFCFDFLGLEHRNDLSTADKDRRRRWVHFGFSMLLLWVIVGFKAAGTMAVIDLVFKLASFTYGPLLGLFALGLATRVRVGGPWVPVVCVASPVICWELSQHSAAWLGGYRFGTELLLLNGALTMVGLALLARRTEREYPVK
jgi:Na+/proline symporter